MNPIAVVIVSNGEVKDSYFDFLEKKSSSKSLHYPPPASSSILRFTKLTQFLQKSYKHTVKVELIQLNNKLYFRLKRIYPIVWYKLFDFNESFDVINSFLNRSFYYKKPLLSLDSGSYNVIAGRFSEKLIHEWISHPAEDNLTIPNNFSATEINNNKSRLSSISFNKKNTLIVPKNWLYLRHVSKGSYSPIEKKVSLFVKEAFVKNNGLIQSVCPFSCSFDLETLNKCFSGVVSEKNSYSSGYFCQKFGQTVFGTVKSGNVLFKNINVIPKGELNE